MTNNDASGWKPPTPEKATYDFLKFYGESNTIINVNRYPRIENDSDPSVRQRYYISAFDVNSRRAVIHLRPDIDFWTWLRDPNRDLGNEVASYESIEAMAQAGWFSYAAFTSPEFAE